MNIGGIKATQTWISCSGAVRKFTVSDCAYSCIFTLPPNRVDALLYCFIVQMFILCHLIQI